MKKTIFHTTQENGDFVYHLITTSVLNQWNYEVALKKQWRIQKEIHALLHVSLN